MAVYRVYKNHAGKYSLSATLSTKGVQVKRVIATDVDISELATAVRSLADSVQRARVARGMVQVDRGEPGVTG